MATIKSFTSLEQSKKLAEILPLESADMGWNVFVDDSIRCLPIDDWDLVKDGSGNVKFYPAWNLAALLDVLPILDNRSPVIPKTFDGKYRVVYHSTACERGIFTHDYDNPVDACVAMIENLNGLKML